MNARRRASLAGLLAIAVLTLLPAMASAHPLGNFSVNHYAALTVSPETVSLDVVVDTAEIPTLDLLRDLDRDGDGVLSSDEADAARASQCADLAGGLVLTLDGSRLPLDLTAAGLFQKPGAAELTTLRLVCEFSAVRPAVAAAAVVLAFSDTVDVDRVGWREIVVRGNGVTLGPSSASTDDVSRRLTRYPADLLSQPLAIRAIEVEVTPGGPAFAMPAIPDAFPLTGAAAPVSTAEDGQSTIGAGSGLAGLISFGDLSLPAVVFGLLLAAVVGAGHALSPGHGKTVMAAYLVGSAGRPMHALLFGLAVTVSHTVGVLGLALVVWLAADFLPPERLYPILTVVSGMTVTILGAILLTDLLRRRRQHAAAHAHAHPHSHGHEHSHPAAPGQRRLIVLGAAGGLVPSTAALVLLLGAVAAGQPAYGVALALAFGVGMAVVLGGIGLALVQGRRWIGARTTSRPGWHSVTSRLVTIGPWVLASTVLLGGVMLTSQALVVSL